MSSALPMGQAGASSPECPTRAQRTDWGGAGTAVLFHIQDRDVDVMYDRMATFTTSSCSGASGGCRARDKSMTVSMRMGTCTDGGPRGIADRSALTQRPEPIDAPKTQRWAINTCHNTKRTSVANRSPEPRADVSRQGAGYCWGPRMARTRARPCMCNPPPPFRRENPNVPVQRSGEPLFQQNRFPVPRLSVPGPKHTFLLVVL